MVFPIPLRQLLQPLHFNIPAAALFEVGLHNLRHQHPYPRIEDVHIYSCHCAEININILKCLLHAFVDGGSPDGNGRLPTHDEVDIR